MKPITLALAVAVCSGDATGASRPTAEESTLESRFPAPEGCDRVAAAAGSYAAYLRQLPLKPAGADVHDYAGRVVDWGSALGAVLDIDLVRTQRHADLQQCADLALRLWAEYRFAQKAADGLRFTLQNGQALAWKDWQDGTRGTVVRGRHVFARASRADASYASFRAYLGYVMEWLGSAGIKAHAEAVTEAALVPGDLLVQNSTGSIGHVSIIADMCVRGAERRYLVVQSYMPAQEGHVLLPAEGEGEGAWFTLPGLRAHQAHFGPGVLRRLP